VLVRLRLLTGPPVISGSPGQARACGRLKPFLLAPSAMHVLRGHASWTASARPRSLSTRHYLQRPGEPEQLCGRGPGAAQIPSEGFVGHVGPYPTAQAHRVYHAPFGRVDRDLLRGSHVDQATSSVLLTSDLRSSRKFAKKSLSNITHLGDARISASCYLRIRRCNGMRRMVTRSRDEVNDHIE
jgi:hypothetical protein